MKNQKKPVIAFLGLAQNCTNGLVHFFSFIEKIQNDFSKIYVFIGENHSNDNTFEMLRDYKNKKITKKIINTSFMKKYSYRLEKMARGRNRISKCTEGLKLDYVVWLDLDDVLSNGINRKEFLDSITILNKNKNLFGVSAISIPFYYDILSLRIKNYFMKNIYYISKVKNLFVGYNLRKKYIYNIQKKVNKINKLSISSFNGMCIYKFEYFKFSSYINFNKSKKKLREQVEHVTFNEIIHKKYKKYIFINNNLRLAMPKEHTPYSNFASFLIYKIQIFIKKPLKLFRN